MNCGPLSVGEARHTLPHVKHRTGMIMVRIASGGSTLMAARWRIGAWRWAGCQIDDTEKLPKPRWNRKIRRGRLSGEERADECSTLDQIRLPGAQTAPHCTAMRFCAISLCDRSHKSSREPFAVAKKVPLGYHNKPHTGYPVIVWSQIFFPFSSGSTPERTKMSESKATEGVAVGIDLGACGCVARGAGGEECALRS